MKILTFAGSLRKKSLNKKLCDVVVELVKKNNYAEIESLDLRDLDVPFYDEDVELETGTPEGVLTLNKKIIESDAVVICIPEYNGSFSGFFKNMLDWLSRQKPNPFSGKPVLLMSASTGGLGGVRGLWHTRQPLDAVGAQLYPEMMGVPKAQDNIAQDNTLSDLKLQANLDRLIKNFISHAKKLS